MPQREITHTLCCLSFVKLFITEKVTKEMLMYQLVFQNQTLSYYEIISKSSNTLCIKGETAPAPGGLVFWPINMAWTNWVEVHPRNMFTTLFDNQSDSFGREFLFKFSLKSYEGKQPHPPWRPYFSANPHGLKESDRGSTKEHFYKLIESIGQLTGLEAEHL